MITFCKPQRVFPRIVICAQSYVFIVRIVSLIRFATNISALIFLITYGIIDMNNYEEIMDSLVKLRDYCRKNSSCRGCEFEDFCELNLEDTYPIPSRWVFDGEEIICDG